MDIMTSISQKRHRRTTPLARFASIALFILASQAVLGQQPERCQKIGFADIDMISRRMPETRQMEVELASLGSQLQNQLKAKYADYNDKLAVYESVDSPTPSRPTVSREELIRLQSEIQKFTNDAELAFQKKQQQLMQPILLRISKTIDEVANEHQYTIILNKDNPAGQGMVLFVMREYDISELVLQKMGLPISTRKQE